MLLTGLESRVVAVLAPEDPPAVARPIVHLLWFLDGLILFFLVSWLGTDVLSLDNDFYYAVFIWTALTFLYYYVRSTRSDVLQWVRVRWRSSLFFGVLAAIYVVANVLKANATARPSGALLLFELAWRGLAYGAVDSLVLTAFPLAVALGLVGSHTILRLERRILLATLTFALIWTMSTAYHLGFAQFDDNDLVEPQLTTTAVSMPAMITANPVGSIAAQTALHVAATLHTFESDVFVPPEVEFIPDYEPPGVFGPR